VSFILWVLNNWSLILTAINALGSLGLLYAHLTNKANVAQVISDIEKLAGRIDVKPDPDSAQAQSELKNPKI
jgi:hypothetical protein